MSSDDWWAQAVKSERALHKVHQQRLTAAREAVVEAAKMCVTTDFSGSWNPGAKQHDVACDAENALRAAVARLLEVESEHE